MCFIYVVIMEDWNVLFLIVGFEVDKVGIVGCGVNVRGMVNVDVIVYIVMECGNVCFYVFQYVFFVLVIKVEFLVFIGFRFQIWVIDNMVFVMVGVGCLVWV